MFSSIFSNNNFVKILKISVEHSRLGNNIKYK